jgi:hypothetical protein
MDKQRYGAGIIDAEAAIHEVRGQAGATELGLGALIALGIAMSLRRRGMLGLKVGGGYAIGVLVGASGLFFLPYLSATLSSLPVIATLTHGLPAWTMGAHGGDVFFMSAAIPLALVALGGGVPRFRPLLAGLSAGVAGHLLFQMAAGWTDVRFMVMDGLWLAVNAAVLCATAHLTLRRG